MIFYCLQGEAEEEDENLPVQEVSFDPEKAQCCVVENSQGLTHGSGGKGYGLASTGISSGCYQWKVNNTFIHKLLLKKLLKDEIIEKFSCLNEAILAFPS